MQRANHVPDAVAMHVEGGPVHIPHGRLHRPDPVPALERPGERLLGDVLGLGLVPADDDERAHDGPVVLPEEGLERSRPLALECHRTPRRFVHALITPRSPAPFGSGGKSASDRPQAPTTGLTRVKVGERKGNLMPGYRYLIVGGGLTADGACKGIREVDQDGSIGVVGSEPHPPYLRPPLTKDLWK